MDFYLNRLQKKRSQMAYQGPVGGEDQTEKGTDRVISAVIPKVLHFKPSFIHEGLILLRSPGYVKVF